MKPVLRTSAARALVWLVMGLTPLQGMAGAVLATLGPSHVHQVAPQDQRELEDVRRVASPPPAAADRHRAMFGHSHGAASPSRHRHATNDASVRPVADDAARQLLSDGDELNVSPALGALALPLPDLIAWRDPGGASAAPPSRIWPPLTHDPEPLERPPRGA